MYVRLNLNEVLGVHLYGARKNALMPCKSLAEEVEIKESEIQYLKVKRKKKNITDIVSSEICISNKIDDKHCMLFPLNYHNLDVLLFFS